MPNFFDKEKYALHYEILHVYLRLRLKLKKNASLTRTQSIKLIKTICQISRKKKKNRSQKKKW